MVPRITAEIYQALNERPEIVELVLKLKCDIIRLGLCLDTSNGRFCLDHKKGYTLFVGTSFKELRAYVDGYEAGHSAAGPGM